MPNNSAALLMFPEQRFMACSIAFRSSCSKFKVSVNRPVFCGSTDNMKSSGRNHEYCERITARSIACCNSRTLPGQWYPISFSLASLLIPCIVLLYLAANFFKKKSANKKISSPLFYSSSSIMDSGGICISMVLIRYNKS